MRGIIVINSPSDADALLRVEPTLSAVAGLPRHFLAHEYEAVKHLAELDFVLSVEPDSEMQPCAAQPLEIDVQLTNANWAIARIIRRRPPWDVTRLAHPINTFFDCVRDGSGVDIYIFDTGVRVDHDEFGGRASIEYEYATAGADGDDNGHGTGGASCAAGDTVGLARGSDIFSFKISTGSNGAATSSSIVAGIGAAITHYDGRSELNRPCVANFSYSFNNTAITSAVADLIDAGVVVVGAAGNDGVDLDLEDSFPGEATDAICVAAHTMCDTPAMYRFSVGTSYGSNVTVVAPGLSYRVADWQSDSGYARSSGGTSYATAYTTGVLACMLQGHSRLTGRSQVQAVKAALIANATEGRLKIPINSHVPAGGLPDRILYLNPTQTAPENIPGISA